MTFTARELRKNGVDPLAIEVRVMRRRLKLTIPECAAMLGWHGSMLQEIEIGKRKLTARHRIELYSLLERWQRVEVPR